MIEYTHHDFELRPNQRHESHDVKALSSRDLVEVAPRRVAGAFYVATSHRFSRRRRSLRRDVAPLCAADLVNVETSRRFAPFRATSHLASEKSAIQGGSSVNLPKITRIIQIPLGFITGSKN